MVRYCIHELEDSILRYHFSNWSTNSMQPQSQKGFFFFFWVKTDNTMIKYSKIHSLSVSFTWKMYGVLQSPQPAFNIHSSSITSVPPISLRCPQIVKFFPYLQALESCSNICPFLLPTSIPLCGCTTVCLITTQWRDVWFVSSFW